MNISLFVPFDVKIKPNKKLSTFISSVATFLPFTILIEATNLNETNSHTTALSRRIDRDINHSWGWPVSRDYAFVRRALISRGILSLFKDNDVSAYFVKVLA